MPVIRRTELSNLQECLVNEVTVAKENCFLIFSSSSPSQNHEERKTFCSDLNFLLNSVNEFQSSSSILVGDFYAKFSKWYSTDKNSKARITLNITLHQLQVMYQFILQTSLYRALI